MPKLRIHQQLLTSFSHLKMKLLLNFIFLQLSSVSGNVFGRPRTLAQRAKRLRVNDFVDKYEDVQEPVAVVEVQSEVAEEISEFPGMIWKFDFDLLIFEWRNSKNLQFKKEGMLLDVGLISAERNSETEKKRKVQKPFDWVATKNDNWQITIVHNKIHQMIFDFI